ncbi:hypothetical protein BS47DRAFT_1369260 [Hydnum rufescens UP504]|uniref:Uncharacterized protein n=1 Tax=Hydnum rufescens UP504 TaxID=1448309 RepID=A0A9P6AEP4_9AGAM|nr:hypothetical protein BS47DRAFT_1369260 [Hydnum rufescens UP504]
MAAEISDIYRFILSKRSQHEALREFTAEESQKKRAFDLSNVYKTRTAVKGMLAALFRPYVEFSVFPWTNLVKILIEHKLVLRNFLPNAQFPNFGSEYSDHYGTSHWKALYFALQDTNPERKVTLSSLDDWPEGDASDIPLIVDHNGDMILSLKGARDAASKKVTGGSSGGGAKRRNAGDSLVDGGVTKKIRELSSDLRKGTKRAKGKRKSTPLSSAYINSESDNAVESDPSGPSETSTLQHGDYPGTAQPDDLFGFSMGHQQGHAEIGMHDFGGPSTMSDGLNYENGVARNSMDVTWGLDSLGLSTSFQQLVHVAGMKFRDWGPIGAQLGLADMGVWAMLQVDDEMTSEAHGSIDEAPYTQEGLKTFQAVIAKETSSHKVLKKLMTAINTANPSQLPTTMLSQDSMKPITSAATAWKFHGGTGTFIATVLVNQLAAPRASITKPCYHRKVQISEPSQHSHGTCPSLFSSDGFEDELGSGGDEPSGPPSLMATEQQSVIHYPNYHTHNGSVVFNKVGERKLPKFFLCLDACFALRQNKDYDCHPGQKKQPGTQDPQIVPPGTHKLPRSFLEAWKARVKAAWPVKGHEHHTKHMSKQGEYTVDVANGEGDCVEPGLHVPNSYLDNCGVCHHDRVIIWSNMWMPREQQFYALAIIDFVMAQLPVHCCQIHQSILKWNLLPQWMPWIIFGISVFHAYSHQWRGLEHLWRDLQCLIPNLCVTGIHHQLFLLDLQIEHQDHLKLCQRDKIQYTDEYFQAQFEAQQAYQSWPLEQQSKKKGFHAVEKILAICQCLNAAQDLIKVLQKQLMLVPLSDSIASWNEVAEITTLIAEQEKIVLCLSKQDNDLMAVLQFGDPISYEKLKKMRGHAWFEHQLNMGALKAHIIVKVCEKNFETHNLMGAFRSKELDHNTMEHTMKALKRCYHSVKSLVVDYNKW